MASEGAEPAATPRLCWPADWFDVESAAVVTILLGVVQVVLSAGFVYAMQTPPKLFFFTLLFGVLVVAGGALAMASERSPSRVLVQGCACSNVLGLLAALLGFGLYCHSITSLPEEAVCLNLPDDDFFYSRQRHSCPAQQLQLHSWCVTLQLMLYAAAAAVMHCFLSAGAVRTLKTASPESVRLSAPLSLG